jgi:hypothetical protein
MGHRGRAERPVFGDRSCAGALAPWYSAYFKLSKHTRQSLGARSAGQGRQSRPGELSRTILTTEGCPLVRRHPQRIIAVRTDQPDSETHSLMINSRNVE